ncbi:hypothetical protein FRY74_08835 [Vicingus serpentipes]|uniref:DoxX family protein n=1 Tax=Vicingus serpentipes TaxID=1926625 RepID=A0A5C6RQF1_9FLAO|nr:hypothetical protein FRY74_08835 [Vicingus serpentipes]
MESINLIMLLAYFVVGLLKLIYPKHKLEIFFGLWVSNIKSNFTELIGVIEIISSVFAVLPLYLDTYPYISIICLFFLLIQTVGIIGITLYRSEYNLGLVFYIILLSILLLIISSWIIK